MLKYNVSNKWDKNENVILFIFVHKKLEGLSLELDKKCNGLINQMLGAKDFEGKKLQMSFSRAQDMDIKTVLLVGMGEAKDFNARVWKQAMGASVITLQNKKITELTFVLPNKAIKKIGLEKIGAETVIAIENANYSFDYYKSAKDAKVSPVKEVKILAGISEVQENKFKKGLKKGGIVAEAMILTRHLGNIPPSIMTPALLAKSATDLAKGNKKIKVKVMSLLEIKKNNMGCLLGVSRGSVEEPKFIVLEYYGGLKKAAPTVLAGKGITFDSGGLGIKPGNFMNDMKFDMLGAATVLGIIKAVASLGLRVNLVGLIPACENMPSGSSYRPDDILTAYNGKTVEIIHTDAEGRLILADALSYASKYKPKEVIDFATLTGACLVALGNERSGLFGNNDKIIAKLKQNGDATGEQLWQLPLGEEYSEAMKSEVADIKNLGGAGAPGFGGASTAAAFLQFFTDYPWAHIDLSSAYYDGKGKPWIRGGANGFGVQTMVEYLS